MSDERDTKRWRAGASPIAGLTEALIALSAERASDAELAQLHERVAPQLAAPSMGGAGAAASASAWWSASRLWPWLSAALIGIGAMWSIVGVDGAQHDPTSSPVIGPAVTQPARATAHVATPPKPVPAPPELGSPELPPAPAARTTSKRAPHFSAEPPADVQLTAEGEIELLREAQRALNRSASTALTLADEHARLYPKGVFVQEREMLRIEAELKLGKRAQALARAHAFSERFAQSTYRARIERLLAAHRTLKNREAEAPGATQ